MFYCSFLLLLLLAHSLKAKSINNDLVFPLGTLWIVGNGRDQVDVQSRLVWEECEEIWVLSAILPVDKVVSKCLFSSSRGHCAK